MALIRKAIADAMSKVAVGIQPDDISLDFLSGKGALRNLGMLCLSPNDRVFACDGGLPAREANECT